MKVNLSVVGAAAVVGLVLAPSINAALTDDVTTQLGSAPTSRDRLPDDFATYVARGSDRVPPTSPPTTKTKARRTAVGGAGGVEPSSDVWWLLAGCETGYRYDNPNTGNGFYGYFQFDLQTWQSVGGPGYPHEHSYEVQRSYAQALQTLRGWSPWPHCSRVLGLR